MMLSETRLKEFESMLEEEPHTISWFDDWSSTEAEAAAAQSDKCEVVQMTWCYNETSFGACRAIIEKPETECSVCGTKKRGEIRWKKGFKLLKPYNK